MANDYMYIWNCGRVSLQIDQFFSRFALTLLSKQVELIFCISTKVLRGIVLVCPLTN